MVPTFDKFMLPILDWLKDGQIRTNREAHAKMKEVFSLTEDDVNEQTPKGGSRYTGNVNWALTFLSQAGLTQKPRNGQHQISDLGRSFLAEGLKEISEKDFVKRFGKSNPKFFNPNKIKKGNQKEEHDETCAPIAPEEAIKIAINKIDEALISELLEMVKRISPSDFEKLVLQLLVKMGYGGSLEDAATLTKFSKDEGIDGIIKEDILGLDSIYIQAKRYTDGVIGRPALQAFVGALSPHHAKKGVFITTSSFSEHAIDFAKRAEARIILIDGYQLCKYMLQFNLGVSTRKTIEIKAIDSDYFNFD